jgi:hypothetical protein
MRNFLRSTGSAVILAFLGFSGAGCAHRPLVASESLPLRRVVLYRNGVAYFERGAEVRAPNVEFHVRESELGDFLASLSILEASGRKVKAAAYPVEAVAQKSTPQGGNQRSRTVNLELEGPPGKLSVGYIAHSPVWKPAYRVVVLGDGKALLQSWAVVHNRSGEDWSDVRLSVVSGAPIAFRSTLGEAFVPTRPVLEDHGDVVAAIPQGGAIVGGPAVASVAAAGSRREAKRAEREPHMAAAMPAPNSEAYAYADRAASEQGAPWSPPPPVEEAAVAQSGSMSRFDLPSTITVPDGSATMALLNAKTVKGDVVLLFAPDARVGESQQFPWRVARFTNEIGATLERGPVAVFGQGAFLGEGELPSLMAGSDATIPFALDRGMTVKSVPSAEQGGSRVAIIRDGQLQLKTEHRSKVRYEAQSAEESPQELRIRHGYAKGARVEGPAGVKLEEEFGRSSVLVPLTVPARGKAEVTVAQVTEFVHVVDWYSAEAELALEAFAKGDQGDAAAREKVAALLPSLDRLRKLRQAREAAYTELAGLEQEQRELRANLAVLEKNPQAADLRGKLLDRLSRAARRADDLTKKRIENELAENLERVQLDEKLKGLVVAVD